MDRAQPVSGTGHEKRDASRIKLLSPGEQFFYSSISSKFCRKKIEALDNFSYIFLTNFLIRHVYLFVIIKKKLKSFELLLNKSI